jgi:hypothetical protein
MHCKACDALLTKKELTRTNPDTKQQEELCTACLLAIEDIVDLKKLPYHEDIVGYGDCC